MASNAPSATANGGATRLLRFTSHRYFRSRLILSVLSGRPVRIDAIRADSSSPGLRDYEASFLRLLEKVTNGSHVEISYTGTSVLLRPGSIAGGNVTHDCGTTRGVGYFLEWMAVLAPFAKRELTLTLKGITTGGDRDLGADSLRTVTLPTLALFLPETGTLSSALELRVLKRGAPPGGGGEILFRCPTIATLTTLNFTAPGRIRKIRGIASATRVSPQLANRLIDAARGVLGRYIPDLYLFADVYRGDESGKSPGYALTLVATSTTGATLSAEATSPNPPTTPEDLAVNTARQLLAEIKAGGCIDRAHQPLVLLLMALSPQDVAKCSLANLTPQAVQMLRDIRDALGVSFKVSRQEDDHVLVSCVGINYRGYKKVA